MPPRSHDENAPVGSARVDRHAMLAQYKAEKERKKLEQQRLSKKTSSTKLSTLDGKAKTNTKASLVKRPLAEKNNQYPAEPLIEATKGPPVVSVSKRPRILRSAQPPSPTDKSPKRISRDDGSPSELPRREASPPVPPRRSPSLRESANKSPQPKGSPEPLPTRASEPPARPKSSRLTKSDLELQNQALRTKLEELKHSYEALADTVQERSEGILVERRRIEEILHQHSTLSSAHSARGILEATRSSGLAARPITALSDETSVINAIKELLESKDHEISALRQKSTMAEKNLDFLESESNDMVRELVKNAAIASELGAQIKVLTSQDDAHYRSGSTQQLYQRLQEIRITLERALGERDSLKRDLSRAAERITRLTEERSQLEQLLEECSVALSQSRLSNRTHARHIAYLERSARERTLMMEDLRASQTDLLNQVLNQSVMLSEMEAKLQEATTYFESELSKKSEKLISKAHDLDDSYQVINLLQDQIEAAEKDQLAAEKERTALVERNDELESRVLAMEATAYRNEMEVSQLKAVLQKHNIPFQFEDPWTSPEAAGGADMQEDASGSSSLCSGVSMLDESHGASVGTQTTLDISALEAEARTAVDQFKAIRFANSVLHQQMIQNKSSYEVEIEQMKRQIDNEQCKAVDAAIAEFRKDMLTVMAQLKIKKDQLELELGQAQVYSAGLEREIMLLKQPNATGGDNADADVDAMEKD
ncbi:uncharacterized protein BJ171DRAFT_500679 [Polychytrium aggregatum]|uniref:uncharacterized protein n=1 Tax=Polychytrium aggregatum TaxID=110093 RepID=UPI0022FE5A4F|nr:uncharacterized protein BJ171DRAFT_500679 [Polychytrium aggregatum]KAI9205517.1 hypothetical protein BJ171DRAFT_500679 [Polychytrium aggregatum]